MTDTSNYSASQARAEAEAWLAKAAEIEAQQAEQPVHEGVPQTQYEPAVSGPGPRELALNLYNRGVLDGLRDEDAHGLFIAASARAAMRGDQRFIVPDATTTVRAGSTVDALPGAE